MQQYCQCGKEVTGNTSTTNQYRNTLYVVPKGCKEAIIIYAECEHGITIIDKRKDFGLLDGTEKET
jgi:hypothetical protein